jgi:diguanylate cyclase (GGDEF)-like protein
MPPVLPSNMPTSPFESHLDIERIRSMREIALLASFLYLVFGILDIWAIPSAVTTVWLIRGTVVIVLMSIFWLTRFPFFLRHYVSVTVLFYLVLGAGIEAMIFIARPDDLARHGYYTGLMLVVMALYTWSFLKLWQTALVGLLLVLLYVLIAAPDQWANIHREWPILAMNCFFFVSANIIGIFATVQRNRYLRDSFLLSERLANDLVQAEQLKEQTEYWAEHDSLTGLPNRKYLMSKLDAAILAASQTGHSLALLFVDLDGFKPINDAAGHAAGDQVLRVVGQRLVGCVRENDLLARIGGDEFVVVLQIQSSQENIPLRIAENIIASIEQPIRDPDVCFPLSASIGIAIYPDHASDAPTLLHVADLQMYRAKQQGKASVCIATGRH